MALDDTIRPVAAVPPYAGSIAPVQSILQGKWQEGGFGKIRLVSRAGPDTILAVRARQFGAAFG
jgi:hypothetical protein